ncbi:HPr kinase/phosphorylase [Alcaligenaceae bacterium SJ-26]|nr:HPr kinase/phosphorylase [Alcaligenaceae bacterium SJ-26]
MQISVRELIEENADEVAFRWVAGQEGAHRIIRNHEGSSAADLVGHLNLTHPDRIQVFGPEEMVYFARLSNRRRLFRLAGLMTADVPALLIADGQEPPADLITHCNQHNLPLLATKLPASHVIELLRIYLSKKFAPATTVHGVFMDVLGVGVLITGESGLGKSELALELISRGHGLVADDAVEFLRIAPNMIEGRCPALLQNLIEVRGLGLLDIRTIFGEASVRRKMRLKLIVHLMRALSPEQFERLPLQDQTQEILGLPVLKVQLQVAAGRNLAVLVEAAVRNTILKLRGIDTLREFMARQTLAMQQHFE